MPRALITGIAGQDGSYLAEFLLEKGYDVFGMVRQPLHETFARIEHIRRKLHLMTGDLTDQTAVDRVIEESAPDEIYNLASLSNIHASWSAPVSSCEISGIGTVKLLESVRRINPRIRLFQASSSDLFGKVREIPQNESTPFNPRSPYGIAKLFAHYFTVSYRESFDMFCCSGIMFNHESPRRDQGFVSRKITRAAAAIKSGLTQPLVLGNLDSKRDWGFAGDYVEAMWLCLNADEPDDYVISTGKSHSVRELLQIAFERVGLDWRDHVENDVSLLRPSDADYLLGDSSKARETLGWAPRMTFEPLIEMMVDADLASLKKSNAEP